MISFNTSNLQFEDVTEEKFRMGASVSSKQGTISVLAGLRPNKQWTWSGHFEGEETQFARRFVVVPYDIPRRCAATYFRDKCFGTGAQVAEKSNSRRRNRW